jgi:hypothetical protein
MPAIGKLFANGPSRPIRENPQPSTISPGGFNLRSASKKCRRAAWKISVLRRRAPEKKPGAGEKERGDRVALRATPQRQYLLDTAIGTDRCGSQPI